MPQDFEQTIEASHAALDQIVRGSADGYKALYSRGDDVTLANPFGGIGRGWDGVVEQLDRGASHYRDGRATGFEMVMQHVGNDLAYTVEIERCQSKVGGADELSDIAVRVTCVYRLEDDSWKLVHRHADPRVGRQTAESVIQR